MRKINIDRLDMVSFLNGLVFYAPVALLVRTNAGVTMTQFFVLQAILSLTVFLFEVPTGMVTDRIGYKNTLILAQSVQFLAKLLLLAAFVQSSYLLFVSEAIVEGFAACFLSGTQDAYIYSVYQNERYAVKMARVANFGTAGFIVSTMFYVVLYHFWGICALIIATLVACGTGILSVAGIAREPVAKPDMEQENGGIEGSVHEGIVAVFMNLRMVFMVLLASGFTLAFLLINFFYVDKLILCGLPEELMSVIIIAYSAIQMLAEKLLDHLKSTYYRAAMLTSIILSGMVMILFAFSQAVVTVVVIMVLLPLFLSFPAFILDSMQNTHIDQCGQSDKRATVLSIANMVGNLMELVFLFASAYIVTIGVSACFAGAAVLLVASGLGVFLCTRAPKGKMSAPARSGRLKFGE